MDSDFIGRRVFLDAEGHLWLHDGEYGQDSFGQWSARTPNGLTGNLSGHTVTEHGDGTITVSPSILVSGGDKTWHGFLEQGVWKQVK